MWAEVKDVPLSGFRNLNFFSFRHLHRGDIYAADYLPPPPSHMEWYLGPSPLVSLECF
jgi:hypothetical protein